MLGRGAAGILPIRPTKIFWMIAAGSDPDSVRAVARALLRSDPALATAPRLVFCSFFPKLAIVLSPANAFIVEIRH